MSHKEEMRKAFIRDIAAHPEDMARRLIFADWLEDNGEPERAEFIQIQIELAKHPLCLGIYPNVHLVHPRCEGCEVVNRLYPRMEDLWYLPAKGSGFTEEQCKGMALSIGGAMVDCQNLQLLFRNGFVEEIHAPLATLEGHLPSLVLEHPLRVARATDKEPTEERGAFVWYRGSSHLAGERTTIPEEVFLQLPKDDDGDYAYRCRFLAYHTADAAHAALSIALFDLARRS